MPLDTCQFPQVRDKFIIVIINTIVAFRRNPDSRELLKISDGLSYFVPDLIVLAGECIRIEKRFFDALLFPRH
jgi:hypothetical protein